MMVGVMLGGVAIYEGRHGIQTLSGYGGMRHHASLRRGDAPRHQLEIVVTAGVTSGRRASSGFVGRRRAS